MQNVEKRFNKILKTKIQGNVSNKLGKRLRQDLNLDSLDTIELVLYIEKEFDIRFDDEQVNEFSNLTPHQILHIIKYKIENDE